MDIEEQLRSIERMVNGFKIAGDGVIGGFGESALKKDRTYSVEERIQDLESRVAGFSLSGTEDVLVQGSLADGYEADL